MHYRFRQTKYRKIIPRLKLKGDGRGEKLESFPHYVGKYMYIYLFIFFCLLHIDWLVVGAARQMGFADRRECPHLCKLAAEYICKSESCEEEIYAFFADEVEADSLFVKLLEELERCILSYFAFHWSHADLIMHQVLQ